MTAGDRAAHVEREAVALAIDYLSRAAGGIQSDATDAAATLVNVGDLRRVLRVLAALPQTGDAAAAGTTVTEWGVRLKNGRILDQWYGAPMNRQEAETELAQWPNASALISRQRTTFPDVLTDWTTAGADQ